MKSPAAILYGAFIMTSKDIQTAAKDLFDYAIDREEVKWLMAHLHPSAGVNRATVEYELQILKITSVGWSISYYLEAPSPKQALMTHFWQAVRTFSRDLSATTGLMIGQDIDYFEILKQRLDAYVEALAHQSHEAQPAQAIGRRFAKFCGDRQNLFAFMTGSKMFISAIRHVKQYLTHADIK